MGADAVEHKPAAHFGKHAVVVGAGIGGLAAAAALADRFDHVTVIERDAPVEAPAARRATPQARHCHGLLAGGQRALAELFPGIEQHLLNAGAVSVRANQDVREELPGGTVMPQRDFGLTGLTMSRTLLESTLCRQLQQRSNITLRHSTQGLALLADRDGRGVTGLYCIGPKSAQMLIADIVVDASGRGQLTPGLLQSIGRPRPPVSTVGIDRGYTTAVLPRGGEFRGWKAVLTYNAPPSSRRGLILPIEGERWMLTLEGGGPYRPPGNWARLLEWMRQLPTTTLHGVARSATPLGELARFGLAQSVWRHFERVELWPEGLIPLGDALCRFNPVYSQGMAVAAQEARLLQRLLAQAASRPHPLHGLAKAFLTTAQPLIESAWNMGAIHDFALAGTRGEPPEGLERSLRFAEALRRVAARDPEVHRRAIDFWHMLKPRSVLDDPHLVQSVAAEMQRMGGSRARSRITREDHQARSLAWRGGSP